MCIHKIKMSANQDIMRRRYRTLKALTNYVIPHHYFIEPAEIGETSVSISDMIGMTMYRPL